MAKIIKTNGEEVTVTPENGKELSLQQLQDAVEGYIELVPIMNPAHYGTMMFCNEDGIRLSKGYNPVASDIAGQSIMGNVIICEQGEVS